MARKTIDWDNLSKEMNNMGKKTYEDEGKIANLFQPKLKEDGTYDAIIRFLPSPDTDLPFVLVYNHSYQQNGKWMIENCPISIGKKCPICENASKLWNSGHKDDSTKSRFKKFSAYSNILVVKDPQNPDNEGKVFVFRYGKKMFELIKSKMMPSSDLDEAIKVFDWEQGANFKLKIRSKKIKFGNGDEKVVPNYDSSEFSTVSPVGTPEYMDQIDALLHPLKPVLDDGKRYKSFEQLSARLATVEGLAVQDDEPRAAKPSAPKVENTEGGDDDAEFFRRLRGE